MFFCVFARPSGTERFAGWQRRGKYAKKDGIWKTQVQFVFEREAASTGETE